MARPADPIGRNTFQNDQTLCPWLQMIGWTALSKAMPNSLGPHQHAGRWEICYIARGRVDWWVGDERHQVPGGHVYITRPDETHGGIDSTLHPAELYWLVFGPPKRGAAGAASAAQARGLRDALERLKQRTFGVSEVVRQCFERLHAEHRQPDAHSELVVQSLLWQLLAQVVRDHDALASAERRPAEAHDPLVDQATAKIDADLARAPGLGELARSAGLTAANLRQRFVQAVGLSPADYLTLRRLDEAARLLRDSPLTVTQIAFKVGFSSSQYFATAFKKRTGRSPRAYRRAHRREGNNE